MTRRLVLTAILCGLACGQATAADEHDYFKHLRYPSALVPGVGVDKIEQEGGPNAVGYTRRTVHWWPRKGQDIVDIPEGVPLRTWTRDKGQLDKQALAGVCRNWTASDPEQFEAHLIGFRGVGTSTAYHNPRCPDIPAAILRMEDGRPRAVINYGPVSLMISEEDQTFISKVWEEAFPKLYATTLRDDALSGQAGGAMPDKTMKPYAGIRPKLNAMELPKDSEYPRWTGEGDPLLIETMHFSLLAQPKQWGVPALWIRPNDVEQQDRYRAYVMEFFENFWTYVEAAGASMPYWRRPGANSKYVVHIHASRCAGGWGHCGIGNANTTAFGHEFFHGQPLGGFGWDVETMCNAGQHAAHPGQLQMFDGNFQYPWRNVSFKGYGSSLWLFVLSDNPNWGHGIPVVLGCLASPQDHTGYHTVARLGQSKGLWKNGVKGFGDFFGEYAARMVTCDFIEQYLVQCKYGMPELSYLYRVYGHENRYRISNAEAPWWCGFNIIRLKPEKDAKEITVDFRGIYDPARHSDWRACIVAVDAGGKARYSPMWNKGMMGFELKPSDAHLWLTVSASPSAFPVGGIATFLRDASAPRYPWEVTLSGCRPGVPHRRQGDVANFDELYPRTDCRNTYLNYPVKHEVPIPLAEEHGKLAQEKLAAMLPRIEASAKELQDAVDAGESGKGYWWAKKHNMHNDLIRRVKFLQDNAKGRPHPNGGGFVADSAQVAASAYVGPDAMVLDGARVKDNACIKEFAVVFGPKTVISGNAKVGGRAWVFGDIEVTGNARILEGATVTSIRREPWSSGKRREGSGKIAGSAVVKGEHYLFLAYAKDQVLTGGLVLDYHPYVENTESGVFEHGRFCRHTFRKAPSFKEGADAGALYANWQFDRPEAVLLEDSYVNNNGILYGKPEFAEDGERKCIVFNGNGQYAEAPTSVADFGSLTIDIALNRSGDGPVFDFGTGDDACFYLAVAGGKPTLTARHKDKTCSLTASGAIPENKWARLRVEMDGAKAVIYVDGEQVGSGKFDFRPRDVFVGDRAEGNFIACDRSRKTFFKGRLDHFRIYRKVHADFNALGPVPSPLIQNAGDAAEKDENGKESVYHTTADWYGKVHGDGGQSEDELPKMRKWLKSVRGY